jgi:hypothetical protein
MITEKVHLPEGMIVMSNEEKGLKKAATKMEKCFLLFIGYLVGSLLTVAIHEIMEALG